MIHKWIKLHSLFLMFATSLSWASQNNLCENIPGHWQGRWVMEAGRNFICAWYTDAWGTIDADGRFQFQISLHDGSPSSMCPSSSKRTITGICKNSSIEYSNPRYWGGFRSEHSIDIDGEDDYGWLKKT